MGKKDDFESGDPSRRPGADSPAPLPPHERAWRHPSEIGFATVTSIDTEPINIGRTGRSLIGFASVAGVVLSIALVLALQPDSVRSDTDDIVALTNSRLRVASFDHSRSSADGTPTPSNSAPTSIPIELPELSNGSRIAGSRIAGPRIVDGFRFFDESMSAVSRPTQPPESTTTSVAPVAPATRAMGILSESGEHLLTTMAAVEGNESIDVRLPNGTMVRSRIVHTMPDLHVAVLSVTGETTTGARADIKASGLGTDGADFVQGQPVMILIETPLEFVVGQTLDGVIVSLESFGTNPMSSPPIAEGAPVVSKTGHLIGLCTHAGGRLGFVPVNLLESALSKLFTDDGGASTTQPPQ